MGAKLDKKLRPFFFAKTGERGGERPDTSADRYVPRAYSSRGPGWGVYDKREQRFLDDREVLALPTERLMTEQVGATH